MIHHNATKTSRKTHYNVTISQKMFKNEKNGNVGDYIINI